MSTLSITPLRGQRLYRHDGGRWRSVTRELFWHVGVWRELPHPLMTPEEWRMTLLVIGEYSLLTTSPNCIYWFPQAPALGVAYLPRYGITYYRRAPDGQAQQIEPGFFALHATNASWKYVEIPHPPGVYLWDVDMAGTIHEYNLGYRAQKMRMTRLVGVGGGA